MGGAIVARRSGLMNGGSHQASSTLTKLAIDAKAACKAL